MGATTIQDPIAGENLVAIEPELLQQVDPGWLHRLNLFAGRALTAPALQSEQSYRAGRLAILGQCVTAGTVTGLELSADLTQADPVLQVAPGYGISATGEDVALLRTLRTTLGSLQVIDPQLGSVIAAFPDYVKSAGIATYAGVLLLQPVTGQVSGTSVDTGTGPIVVSGNLDASCDQDPEEYAYEDWQIVDGVRLVMVAWPATPATLAIPASSPAASWRNRLVYTVFNAEMGLAPDDQLPWNLLGVPVALIGFDNTWKAQFVDRSAVVRSGGLPRSRYVLPANAGAAGAPLLVQPALAQARVLQFNEQLNTMPALTNFVPAFANIPPCGVLPASAIDFTNQVGLWFPSNWTVEVGPVHQEEIETALIGAMTTQPLDVTQNESVEVLVPLPDALYDPEILLTETVDGAFQTAVNSATQELDGVLQHRKAIQNEANALSQVLTGAPQAPLYNVDAGLTAAEITARDAQVYTPTASETFGTVQTGGAYASTDYQKLLAEAAQFPYTLTQDGNGNPLSTPLTLFSADDLDDLAQNGLQHFIDRINAQAGQGQRSAGSRVPDRAKRYLPVPPIRARRHRCDGAGDFSNCRQYRDRRFRGGDGCEPGKLSELGARGQSGDADCYHDYASSGARSFGCGGRAATAADAQPRGAVAVADRVYLAVAVNRIGTATLAGSSTLTGVTAVSDAASAARLSAASATFTQITPGTVSEPASTSDILQESPVVGRAAQPADADDCTTSGQSAVAGRHLLCGREPARDFAVAGRSRDNDRRHPDPGRQWSPPATASTTAAPTTTVAGAPLRAIMPTIADFRINSGAVTQACNRAEHQHELG